MTGVWRVRVLRTLAPVGDAGGVLGIDLEPARIDKPGEGDGTGGIQTGIAFGVRGGIPDSSAVVDDLQGILGSTRPGSTIWPMRAISKMKESVTFLSCL